MDLFCNLTAQRFAAHVGGRFYIFSKPIELTQNNDQDLRVYLMRDSGNPGSEFPLVYDPTSGDTDLEATITLCNPGGTPLTLSGPTIFDAVPQGFSGVLDTTTDEIATFMGNEAARECILQVDVRDSGGLIVTSFQGPITMRANANPSATSPITGTGVGNSDDLTVSATGTTDLVPSHIFSAWTQRVTVQAGSGTYTHKLTLDNSKAADGSSFRISIAMPASTNPTIEIYDNTTGGTLLQTITGFADATGDFFFAAEYNSETTAWRKTDGHYL